MAKSFETSLKEVRGKRQFIARAANEVLSLTNQEPDKLAAITWDSLLSCVSWCVLSHAERDRLSDVCGAIYLAPIVKTSVDGKLFKSFQVSLGEALFNEVFKLKTLDFTYEIDAYDQDESMPDNLRRVGQSVLLGTLSDTVIHSLYTDYFAQANVNVAIGDANAIYTQAEKLLH